MVEKKHADGHLVERDFVHLVTQLRARRACPARRRRARRACPTNESVGSETCSLGVHVAHFRPMCLTARNSLPPYEPYYAPHGPHEILCLSVCLPPGTL